MRILTILYLLTLTVLVFAHENEPKGYKLIDQYYKEGKINYEYYLLNKFYFIFDKAKLDERFKFDDDSPVKCATPLMIEFEQNKQRLNPATLLEIQSYLERPFKYSPTLSTYDSPGGKFRLTYTTTGTHGVPPADNNNNGVPDYVEWIASYFDYVWSFEIDTLGFLAPPIGTGKYQIGFESMSAYGYTTVVSGKLTRIVMHNNFLGFPPNQDPEGNQKGAAKVTAAHEFKHATQIVYNNWSEPSWFIELDATWMEDIAYDYVNDYYNYITSSGSPFTSPGSSLDAGDGYEDCNWMIFLGEKFDVDINRKIWNRRLSTPSENIFTTFNYILSTFYSSNFQNAFREYIVWNFLTNTRATTTHPGYGEAPQYPLASLCRTVTSYPHNGNNCSITKYSANFIRINPVSNSNTLLISFNGANSPHVFKVTVVTRNTSNIVQSFEIPLDANNDGSYLITIPNNQLQYAGLCIAVVSGNTGPTYTYSITEQTTFTTSININSGWNLLSIPITLNDMSISSIFPDAASNAYGYNNGYFLLNTAQLGFGFWLKFNNSQTKNLAGNPQSSITINVNQGWNIIAPLHSNISTSSITTNPSGIISSLFYGYNNGYQTATTLERGKGYWVKVSSNGTMTIPSTLSKELSDHFVQIKNELSKSPRIIIKDKNGKEGILYLTEEGKYREFGELPPLPPANVFDVRFSDGSFIENLNASVYDINLQGIEFPLNIKIEGINSRIKVIDGITQDLIGELEDDELEIMVMKSNRIRLMKVHEIKNYYVSQNYPNPFNPVTKIVYALPTDGIVNITLYNSLGEELKNILNERVLKGTHEYIFDAQKFRLNSGIYYCRVNITGNDGSQFSKVMKMVLMK